jgi:hypothetical protein
MDYRCGSHTVFQIEYHFVWATKYRYKVLTAEVAERVRELVCQVCATFEIRIVKGGQYSSGANIDGTALAVGCVVQTMRIRTSSP